MQSEQPKSRSERARKLEALAGELELNAKERIDRLIHLPLEIRQAALPDSTEYRAAKVIRQYIAALSEQQLKTLIGPDDVVMLADSVMTVSNDSVKKAILRLEIERRKAKSNERNER